MLDFRFLSQRAVDYSVVSLYPVPTMSHIFTESLLPKKPYGNFVLFIRSSQVSPQDQLDYYLHQARFMRHLSYTSFLCAL